MLESVVLRSPSKFSFCAHLRVEIQFKSERCGGFAQRKENRADFENKHHSVLERCDAFARRGLLAVRIDLCRLNGSCARRFNFCQY